MTNRNHTHRLAGTAIAAFLALSSTTVWAQDAPAPADATVAVPAAQPAPTIILPPVTTVQPAPSPAAEAAPVAEAAPAPRANASVATRSVRAVPARTARPIAAAPKAAAPVASNQSAEAMTAEPPIASEAIPADLLPVEPVTTAAPAGQSDSDGLLLAGLAGVLGLGAIGLFAATRRRRVFPAAEMVEYEQLAVPAQPVAVVTPKPAARVAPSFTPMARWTEPRVPQAQPAGNSALYDNREALLDRMVAAEPDANNPFTSAKGRRRRARLMLQSLESDRWDDAELAPGFDWREMAQAVEERETVKV